MQHLEVLALVGQGLFQAGIVLLEGHVPGPTVRMHLGIVLYMVVEDRPEGFRTVILDDLGVAPAGLAVPVLEGDHHAHLALALAPSLFPGLRGPYLELVHVDLVLQRVLFAALHGRLHFLPEQPCRLLVHPEMFGKPDAVRSFLASGYLIEHLQGLVDAELQFMEQGSGRGRFVVMAFAAPTARRLLSLYVGVRPAAPTVVAVLPFEVGQKFIAGLFIGKPVLKYLSLIHISEPTRRTPISYAVFCLKKKKKKKYPYIIFRFIFFFFIFFFFFLMIRRPPRSTQSRSSAASDVYKRQ